MEIVRSSFEPPQGSRVNLWRESDGTVKDKTSSKTSRWTTVEQEPYASHGIHLLKLAGISEIRAMGRRSCEQNNLSSPTKRSLPLFWDKST